MKLKIGQAYIVEEVEVGEGLQQHTCRLYSYRVQFQSPAPALIYDIYNMMSHG